MDFNIRAISLAESVAANARTVVSEFLGKEIEFTSGISFRITLPSAPEQFAGLPEPERLLLGLDGWSRVYRYPENDRETLHVIATTENDEEEIVFHRIDLRQPRRPPRGLRPPVEIVGGAVMDYGECADWLIELSFKLAENRDQAQLPTILARPRLVRPNQMRLAWVGREIIDGQSMPPRLRAIGQVYGAQIVHIPPRAYLDVRARLALALPLDTVIICEHFAPHITAGVVPAAVPDHLIHRCKSSNRAELEQQVRAWIEIAAQEIEGRAEAQAADENQLLLAIMLRGMLSHSKIGQFSHCDKATVLTGVRGRRLNVANAEGILERNSEAFQDTKTSTALFLFKEHNDGRQYFLNPHRVEGIRAMVGR